ncbi:MAG: carboxypeptidase-like regulatory domain-containing protein [Gemmatimonas sp.]
MPVTSLADISTGNMQRFFVVLWLCVIAGTACARRYDYRLEPQCPPTLDFLRVSADSLHPTQIVGHVTNRDTARPLGGASVALLATGAHVVTDSLGEFRFNAVPNGRYAIEVRAIGYTPRTDTVSLSASAGVQMRVPLLPQYFDRCFEVKRVRVARSWWKLW